jgi:hypothetical protein
MRRGERIGEGTLNLREHKGLRLFINLERISEFVYHIHEYETGW